MLMFNNIKLMRKIAIIFISITLISAICYKIIGNEIIELSSKGELERGPGRLNGAISKVQGEVNKITTQAREFGEYFSIAYQIDSENGEGAHKEYINIGIKIEKAPIKNMFAVDQNFNVKEEFKITNIDLESEDIRFVLDESKELINNSENIRKGFVGGVITTDNMPYIVGVKRIGKINEDICGYNIVISPIDNEYMKKIAQISGRDVDLVNGKKVDNRLNEMEKVEIYNGNFYCERLDETIDVYTVFPTIGDGEKYYIRLQDDRTVRNNAENNINKMIFYIIMLTILANLFVYYLIKRNVLTRIININNAVNTINEGNDLAVTLEDDIKGDEISILTKDINGMFGRLKTYADNLQYVGEHDSITALPNRNKIMKEISRLIDNNSEFSLFFIDLDNFKRFNDTLGHNEGDRLLKAVSQKLNSYVNSNNNLLVARIGGDEFIVVKQGENLEETTQKVAKEINETINSIYKSHEWVYEVKGSIGISYYPQHAEDEVSLLQYADIAMYNSKNAGGDSFSIFNSKMLTQIEMENRIVCGLENNEFEVYYQPIVTSDKCKIIGAEALIRWNLDGDIISPDKFIPIAKKTGKIIEIDNFVLKEVIKTCKYYLEKGHNDFYISLNASKRFLKQKDIIKTIKNELDSNKVPYEMLRLEITEDEIIEDFDYTIELLNEIRSLGIKILLDDFGVGYSSFNHIKVLPVNIIKVDRSLLQGIEDNKKISAIMETIINLCHNIDLKVVCEGVETEKQFNILKELNCDCIQGYYYSRPITKSDLDKIK